MKKAPKFCIHSFMLVLACLLVIGLDPPVMAHKAVIFAWVEGNTVFTESKFSGGNKAINAHVAVFDRENRKLLDGKTDANGEFSFKVPKLTDIRIVLNAGMGHKAEWSIPESELREASVNLGGKKGDGSSQPMDGSGLSKEEIKALIEDSLDRKLRPIMRMMAESKTQGPTVTEIVGGIGYIFGLMGVALYFKNRGEKRHKAGNK